ncbi:MAG: hypothetical protein HY791_39530 [Deltaproteobacteria bacterium]|nr:hypothetical protein [Deltaproteobacteria bacterium]
MLAQVVSFRQGQLRCWLLVVLVACSSESVSNPDVGAGPVDAGPIDAAESGMDVGVLDATSVDAGALDSGVRPLDPVWVSSVGVPPTDPDDRWGAEAVVAGDRMILFGGSQYPAGDVARELWSLDLGTEAWAPLALDRAPAARYCHCLTFLPDQEQVLLIGGRDGGGPLPRGAWTFHVPTQTWQAIGGTVPAGVIGCGAVWVPTHPDGPRAVVFGGGGASGFDRLTYTYDPELREFQTVRTSSSPPVRQDGMMTFDPTHGGRVLLFGGSSRVFPPETAEPLDDLWAFNGIDWARIPATGPRPSPRRYAADAFDTNRNEWVLFGGTEEVGDFGDLWVYHADSETFEELTFRSESGTGPSARAFASFVYDSARDEFRLFGGFQQPDFRALVDGWTLRLRP